MVAAGDGPLARDGDTFYFLALKGSVINCSRRQIITAIFFE